MMLVRRPDDEPYDPMRRHLRKRKREQQIIWLVRILALVAGVLVGRALA